MNTTFSILYPKEIISGDVIRTSSRSQYVSGIRGNTITKIAYRWCLVNEGQSKSISFSGNYLTDAIMMEELGEDEDTGTWSFSAKYIATDWDINDVLAVEFTAFNELAEEIDDISISIVSLSLLRIAFDEDTTMTTVPTGLSVVRSNTELVPTCSEINYSNYDTVTFLGFNFYVSLTTGSGYTLMNDTPIKVPTSVEEYKIQKATSETESEGVLVKTETFYINDVNKYSYSLNSTVLSSLISNGLLSLSTYDDNTTFYFVATTVLYNRTLDQVQESRYSSEVSARFITFAAVYKEMPARTRDQIVLSMIQRMIGKDAKTTLIPSSVYRDFIDPISEEFSSIYVLQDFFATTNSIRALVRFDDENGDGVSDDVDTSINKMKLKAALKVTDSSTVQSFIDSFFDKKASNNNISRKGSTYATTKVIFYATSIPTEGLYVNKDAVVTTASGYSASGGSVAFTVDSYRKISYDTRSSFWNSVENRYEIELSVTCSTIGSYGNVPSGSITIVQSGCDSRFKVTNDTPALGGTDKESNLALANRTQLAISGLDTGTRGGYLLKALSVPGVKFAKVVQAKDDMMYRDIDSTTGEHIGGKVDIYINSDNIGEKQDTVAYSYAGPIGASNNEIFSIIDAVNFRIRSLNTNVTTETPIVQVLSCVNVTRDSQEYYLPQDNSFVNGDGDIINIPLTSYNLKIGMATKDIIKVDYRYKGSDAYILENQPVQEIVSVTGDIDGTLSEECYTLLKLEDPLFNGSSTIAKDSLQINVYNSMPTDSVAVVDGEAHTFFASEKLKLAKKGVDSESITVSSDENGVYVYSLGSDYTIERGGNGYTYLNLQAYSKIRSGSTVYVNYGHAQNLTIVYKVNDTLLDVQSTIDEMRHGAADVVIKDTVKNEVDISLEVTRLLGYDEDSIETKIKTVVSNYINNLDVGEGAYVDDIIKIVKDVVGVKRVTVPITCMMRKNGSFISNDYIGKTNFKVYSNNSCKGITSFISANSVLNYSTVAGGGDSNLFRAIYEGDHSLVLSDTPLEVSQALGRGYIMADGRIVVSTTDGSAPQSKVYSASYYTYVSPGSEYASDIIPNDIEFLIVGSDSIEVDASAVSK